MDRKQIESVVSQVYARLKSVKGAKFTYIALAGGAAAWLAGKSSRQPEDIDIWFGVHPLSYDAAMQAVGYHDNTRTQYFGHVSVHEDLYDGVKVNIVGDMGYLWNETPAYHVGRLLDTFDVPQHRVGFTIEDGELATLVNSVYWWDVWSVETMLPDGGEMVTKTRRAYKFKQAGYAMCDRIALLAHAYELGLDNRVFVTKYEVGFGDWVRWQDLPGHICELALRGGG